MIAAIVVRTVSAMKPSIESARRAAMSSLSSLCFALVSAACAPATPPAPALPMQAPPDLRALPAPPLLVGSASPGDVYTLTLSGATFSLRFDNGTPTNAADDVLVGGDVTRRGGSTPLLLSVRSSSNRVRFAIGSTLKALALPGFGYALELGGALVTALEPATCAESSALTAQWSGMAMTTPTFAVFEAAPGARADALRPWPLRGAVPSAPMMAPTFVFGAAEDPGTDWRVTLGACDPTQNHVRPAFSVTTPFTRAVGAGTAPFPYRGPEPASTSAFFTKSGTMVVDFGLGYGAVFARVQPDLAALAAQQQRLDLRLRTRTLIGYLTNYSTFQPAGATREDPSVLRSPWSRTLAVKLVIDGQSGSMQLSSLDGTAVGPAIPVQFFLNGGSLELVAGNNVRMAGITIDNDSGTSFLVSAPDPNVARAAAPAPTAFESTSAIPTPMGTELWTRYFVAHLRLEAPLDCFNDGITLPPEYTDNRARPVPTIPPVADRQIRVAFGGSAPRVEVVNQSPGEAIPRVSDVSSLPRYFVVSRGQAVQLSAPAGHRVRLLCGPEYPWNPGADRRAPVEGVDSRSPGSFGFSTPGVYVIESGPDGVVQGPQSQHFVIEVRQPSLDES